MLINLIQLIPNGESQKNLFIISRLGFLRWKLDYSIVSCALQWRPIKMKDLDLPATSQRRFFRIVSLILRDPFEAERRREESCKRGGWRIFMMIYIL